MIHSNAEAEDVSTTRLMVTPSAIAPLDSFLSPNRKTIAFHSSLEVNFNIQLLSPYSYLMFV